MSRRKTFLFNAATLLSLILLAVLPVGYTGTWGFAVTHARQSATSVIPTYDTVRIYLDSGRLAVWWDPRQPAGPRWRWMRPILRRPSLSRSLWEFDAHFLPTGRGSPQLFLFACPIWCVAVPFIVMPALWWRRRQRRLEQYHVPGFSVLQSDPAPKQATPSAAAGVQS